MHERKAEGGAGAIMMGMVPRSICVFSLHPTRDVILETPFLELGEVGRASSWFSYPAGKALNAARTAGQLPGSRVRAVVLAPPAWGDNLKDFLGRYRVALRHVPVVGEGRVCVMLNERRRETVINTDLNMSFSAKESLALARAVRKEGIGGGFMVFAGSLPPTLRVSRYRDLLRLASSPLSALVLDQTGWRLRAGVRHHPWLIKPNLAEFHQLIGRRTRSWTDLLNAVDEVRRWGVKRILLSLGSRGCLLAGPAARLFAPALKVNVASPSPVGSGDALLGAFLHKVAAGTSEEEALRWGVAAGTANLLHPGACFMTFREIRAMVPRVAVRRV